MAIRPQFCPTCKKPLEIVAEKSSAALKRIIYTLKCGHNIMEKLELASIHPFQGMNITQVQVTEGGARRFGFDSVPVPIEEPSRDYMWDKAYPFQREGVKFLESSNFNALIADEMGLGKTWQALLAIRYNWEALTPCVITCKSSLTYNWLREYLKIVCDCWTPDALPKMNQIPCLYDNGTLPLIPGFPIYIIPMSLLGREEVLKSIRDKIKPKLFIGDEVHNFKNTRSQRTQALYDCLDGVVRDPKTDRIIEQRHKVPHRIMLSGTPIVNRLFEYFPILNIIKPLHFPNVQQFGARWVDYDPQTKKWMGLKPMAKQAFFDLTKGYVIRRTRASLPNLPKRMPDSIIYTSDFQKEYVTLYNKGLDELEEHIENAKGNLYNGDMILGIMSRLRHLAGLLKIKAAVQWATELLENTDEKLLIGIHHIDVAQILIGALSQYKPIYISGADNALAKDQKVTQSKDPKNRLVIGNIEACGEGINGLQETINNALILERGWSPSREDQFIGRLDRPGQKLSVFATYLTAAGTLDDFFTELIKFKRNVTTDGTSSEFQLDRDMMKELAKRVLASRLKVVGA